ncbi:MAG: superoxide dismutase family protein [Burkholderiales bacterium]|jgi:Cu-Zn family superoxide dismutase|nr:superoxide dismutase family protein [Burkholderiales bacterium]
MKKTILIAALAFAGFSAHAASVEVPLNLATDKGDGKTVGTITLSETPYGLEFTPNLEGIDPGIHGFHVHENPNCAPTEKDGKITFAGAAGGHFDPTKTGKHLGPYADGHLGDLPALYATGDGKVTQPVLAPRIKNISEIQGRSIMVHVGGDNHSDHPATLGGGGARLACGIIK